MPGHLELEKDRYKITAMLLECILFEYHVESKTVYIFGNSSGSFKNAHIIEDFRYSEKVLSRINEEDLEKFYQFFNRIESGIEKPRLELRIIDDEGDMQWYRIVGTTIFGEDKKPSKVIGRMDNINGLKLRRTRLKEKSEQDPLTTIYNKSTTEKHVNKYLHSHELIQGALFIIDYDNLKKLNDVLGYVFGDSILRSAALQLKQSFRDTDVIGRVGGDEFVVFFQGMVHEDIIEKKVKAIQDIFKSFYKQDQIMSTCCIGISKTPENGKTYKELFRKADIALYQAKKKGSGSYVIYDEYSTDSILLRRKELFYSYQTNENRAIIRTNNLNDLVIRIFNLLYSAKDIDEAIQQILRMAGTEFLFNRVYIAELSEDRRYLVHTYLWADENSSKKEFEPLSGSIYEENKDLFRHDEVLCCGDVADIEEKSEVLYTYLKKYDVKSTMQVMVGDTNQHYAIVSFDDCQETREFLKIEKKQLTIIAKLLGSYLLFIRDKDRIKMERLMIKEIAKSQNMFAYILKPHSFEILYVNENTMELYPEAKAGDICYETFQSRNIPCTNCPLYALNDAKKSSEIDFYNEVKNIRLKATASKIIWENMEANLVCAAEISDFIAIIQGKDDLTGLPSLPKFEKEVNRLLEKAEKKYVIVSLDIDKFKNINATLGYNEGNNLLICFVDTISASLKMGELFCRSNADKFLLLLEMEDKLQMIERINQIFNITSNYLQAKYSELHIVIVGGMYFIEPNDMDATFAIDRANIARKSIKGSHTSKAAIYDDKIHQRVVREKEVESRMLSALNNKEFIVYLQPKVDLKSRRIVGAEALVRWKTSPTMMIPPNDFIPIFEKNGFISQLDFYVYETVFKKMEEWRHLKKKLVPISVNVSRVHIGDKQFVTKLKKLMNSYNIPPTKVELEITESLFLNETQSLVQFLDELKEIGFNLSIDDFGSGYSSLNMLRNLEMDVLKLDKEFFDQDKVSEKENIVLANIIRMAKELGMIVLSEGVETIDQVDYLTNIGCDLAQGYYFARPMPMEDFEKMVELQSN